MESDVARVPPPPAKRLARVAGSVSSTALSTIFVPVVERQTRQFEELVVVRPCRCNSCRAHQKYVDMYRIN